MIKGHLQIDLHNHNTGLKDRYEQDNLVTNAINRFTPCIVSAGASLSEQLLPLHKRGLGGVYLFNQALTSNADNILFPAGTMEHPIKMVGCAGQTQNTGAIYGSLNEAESHLGSDRSTVSVWDFATHQANGVIRSVALSKTHRNSNYGVNPFNIISSEIPQSHYGFWENGNAVGYSGDYCLWYEDNYFYFLHVITTDSTTQKAEIYKQYRPVNNIRVADAVNAWGKPELIDEIEFNTAVNIRAFDGLSIDNSTRTIYIAYISVGGMDNDGEFRYRTIDIDQMINPGETGIVVSEETVVTINDVHFRRMEQVYDVPLRLCGGYAYIPAITDSSNAVNKVCIVDLLDTTNSRTVSIPGGGTVMYPNLWCGTFEPMPSGGIRIFYYTYQIPTPHYSAYRTILYPDGSFIIDTPYFVGDNPNGMYPGEVYPIQGITDKGYLMRNYPDASVVYGQGIDFIYPDPRYLGTICNLAQAITKTTNTSMKVTYTLTDVTE